MATRRLLPEDWAPVPQTRISIVNVREPRDGRARFPKSVQCAAGPKPRPRPIVGPAQTPPTTNELPVVSQIRDETCDSPREPEIVDLAAPTTWPRRGYQQQHSYPRRATTTSMASECSPRQSELSFGILNYYLDPSPPLTPRIDTLAIDPAIDKFDFGLLSKPSIPLPHPQGTHQNSHEPVSLETKTGAERDGEVLPHLSPPPLPVRQRAEPKTSYKLFPDVKDTTPPSKLAAAVGLQSPQLCTPISNITSVPSHHQPETSYRPRKESMSGSIRSRKDSFNSFSGTRRIPLRILSGTSSNASKTRSAGSGSTLTGSPPSCSRWSNDTITSPVTATTPGPRISFGSLLGRDSVQYPDCFFDDEDEAAPLRRKFAWKRSASLTHEQQSRTAGRFDERSGLGRRVRGILLCEACFGRSI